MANEYEVILGLEPRPQWRPFEYAQAGLPARTDELFAFLNALEGPRDEFRQREDEIACKGLSLSIESCIRWGINPNFVREWFAGLKFDVTNEEYAVTNTDNYPASVTYEDYFTQEVYRFVSKNKVVVYDLNKQPVDITVAPGTILVQRQGTKLRLVADWSHPDCRLSQSLYSVPVDYSGWWDLLEVMRPNCFVSGLDLQDCYAHWMIHPMHRRFLGIQTPQTGKVACHLYLPFGIAPAPGINDRNVKELIRVYLNLHLPFHS